MIIDKNQRLDSSDAYWTQLMSLDKPYIAVSDNQIPTIGIISVGAHVSIIAEQSCLSSYA